MQRRKTKRSHRWIGAGISGTHHIRRFTEIVRRHGVALIRARAAEIGRRIKFPLGRERGKERVAPTGEPAIANAGAGDLETASAVNLRPAASNSCDQVAPPFVLTYKVEASPKAALATA